MYECESVTATLSTLCVCVSVLHDSNMKSAANVYVCISGCLK